MSTNEPTANEPTATNAAAVSPPPPAPSTWYVAAGALLSIFAVLALVITMDAATPSSPFDEPADPTGGLIVTCFLSLAGSIALSIGVIAKGIKIASHESGGQS